MTTRDLSSYVARVKPPTRVSYRGLQIDSTPPPSSGGSTVGEALNILSGWDLGDRAAGDRPVPLPGGVAPGLRRPRSLRRRSTLRPRAVATAAEHGVRRVAAVPGPRARAEVAGRAGEPGSQAAARARSSTVASSASPERHHTNNIVAVDKQGDIAVYTNTINFFGGSGQTVPGYGFLLNDELTDFDFAPAAKGTPDPNLPAGGKQPRSSIGPTIALQHGKPGVRDRRRRRLDDPDHDPADDRQPRRLRHVAAGRARRATGQPDQLADLAGRTGVHATVGCGGRSARSSARSSRSPPGRCSRSITTPATRPRCR